MHGEFLGYSEKQHFSCYTTVITFWATFRKIWAAFNLASGHSDNDPKFEIDSKNLIVCSSQLIVPSE